MSNNFAAARGPGTAGGKWADFQSSCHRGALAAAAGRYCLQVLLNGVCPLQLPLIAVFAVAKLMVEHNVVLMRRCPVTKIDIGDRLALSPNFMVRRQLDGLLRLKAQLAKETEVGMAAAMLPRYCVLSTSAVATSQCWPECTGMSRGCRERQSFCSVAIPGRMLCLSDAPPTGQSAQVYSTDSSHMHAVCEMASHPH